MTSKDNKDTGLRLSGEWKLANSEDFYGELKEVNFASKKRQVMDIYKLFFRFSVEKLFFFVDQLDLIIILIQYIMETNMKRCHHMMSLKLNTTCYYRAAENLINESKFSQRVMEVMKKAKGLASLKYEENYVKEITI